MGLFEKSLHELVEEAIRAIRDNHMEKARECIVHISQHSEVSHKPKIRILAESALQGLNKNRKEGAVEILKTIIDQRH